MSGQAGHIGDGGPAFPVPNNVAWDESGPTAIDGMSLRDYFAAKALAGMCAYHGTYGLVNGPEENAERAFKQADAMLQARGR